MTISYLYVFHSVVFHCLGSVGYVAVPHDADGTEEQIAEAAELNFWKARLAVFDKNLQVIYKLIQKNCLTPSKPFELDSFHCARRSRRTPCPRRRLPNGSFAVCLFDVSGYEVLWSTHTGTARIWMYMKRTDEEFRTIQWCHNLVFWKLDENMRKA